MIRNKELAALPRVSEQEYYTSARKWKSTGNYFYDADGFRYLLIVDKEGKEGLVMLPLFLGE